MDRKKPAVDLKRYYTVFLQIGLVASLAIFIMAVKVDIESVEPAEPEFPSEIPIQLEDVLRIEPVKTPPPPPRPPVPVQVPDDEIIENVDIDINSELIFDDRLIMPPPQKDEEKPEKITFEVVEHMPELIGGLGSIQKLIEYPEMARRAGIEGRVYVQFVVNEKGEIEDPRVIRGIGGGADEEALRAVKQAKFRPGLQRGRPVRVQFSLPIVFKLQN